MTLVTLFRFVEVLVDAPGGASLSFLTDLPGDALAARATVDIPATTGRHPYRMSVLGAVKGKLYQVSITPTGSSAVRVYAAKIYARVLGPQPTAWAWYPIPVLETPVEWQAIKLPIPETSDEWQPMKLPIPATSDDWQAVKLPIEPTGEEWQPVKLPIAPTSEDWSEMKLPVKPTPVVPDWVEVQVDQ